VYSKAEKIQKRDGEGGKGMFTQKTQDATALREQTNDDDRSMLPVADMHVQL
jgi:hypothetical protein